MLRQRKWRKPRGRIGNRNKNPKTTENVFVRAANAAGHPSWVCWCCEWNWAVEQCALTETEVQCCKTEPRFFVCSRRSSCFSINANSGPQQLLVLRYEWTSWMSHENTQQTSRHCFTSPVVCMEYMDSSGWSALLRTSSAIRWVWVEPYN